MTALESLIEVWEAAGQPPPSSSLPLPETLKKKKKKSEVIIALEICILYLLT